MFQNFSGQTSNDVWLSVADAFLMSGGCTGGGGAPVAQSSRAGDTHELLHATLSIEDPRQRWVTVREPAINPSFALAEVIWILGGRNDSAFLTYFNRQLPLFAGEGPTFHGAYGYRLRNHTSFDQLERALLALKASPASRQVVLQIWDAEVDFPLADGCAVAPDIPCNVLSMLKVRDDRLEWMQVLRSNDIYRGLPYNIIQFTSLQEVMAGWLGLELGSYNQLSDSLHLYDSDLAALGYRPVSDSEHNVDDLRLPKADSELVMAELSEAASRVTDIEVPASALIANAVASRLPRAYRNFLLVLTAEGVRRRGEATLATEVMQECSNPVLRHLVSRWNSRLARRDVPARRDERP